MSKKISVFSHVCVEKQYSTLVQNKETFTPCCENEFFHTCVKIFVLAGCSTTSTIMISWYYDEDQWLFVLLLLKYINSIPLFWLMSNEWHLLVSQPSWGSFASFDLPWFIWPRTMQPSDKQSRNRNNQLYLIDYFIFFKAFCGCFLIHALLVLSRFTAICSPVERTPLCCPSPP